MSKKIITLVLAVTFTVASAGAGFAAKSNKCKVTAIDGNTVTLDCAKGTKGLKVGMKVKVKSAKRKAVEGC